MQKYKAHESLYTNLSTIALILVLERILKWLSLFVICCTMAYKLKQTIKPH